MSEPKILVAVRSLASIDELISAVVLAQIIQRNGREVELYLGEKNFSAKLRETISTSDLRLFDLGAEHVAAAKISFKLNPSTKVKAISWEQTDNDINLIVEVDGKTGVTIEDIKGESIENVFSEVYLVGAPSLESIEESRAVITQLSHNNTLAVPGVKSFVVDKYGVSIAEVVAKYAKENNFELTVADKLLLIRACTYARIENAMFSKPIFPALTQGVKLADLESSQRVFSLSATEVEQVLKFWRTETEFEVEDLKEFMGLLKLCPQLNPFLSVASTEKLRFLAKAGEDRLMLTNYIDKDEEKGLVELSSTRDVSRRELNNYTLVANFSPNDRKSITTAGEDGVNKTSVESESPTYEPLVPAL